MNTAKQVIWFFFTILLLAFTGWYYSYSTMMRLDADILATTVDTTLTEVTVSQFNAKGSLVHLLTTPHMQHIPQNNVYLLQTPHILVSQEEQPPWDIRSKKAKSFEGGKQITFIGHVIVHQDKGSKTEESTLKTEEVTYYPKEKKASSDVLVTYEQPGNFIQSTGMNAYLDEKRVELLHQARGSYVPSTS